MRRHIPTALTGWILAQMRFMRQSTDLLAGAANPHRLYKPLASTVGGLRPAEARLNPIEFHGRRLAPTLQSPQDKSTG